MIIDLVVASVLMSMGMMMLSPVLISLPFKLMLFVLVDGWSLVMGTLAASFYSHDPRNRHDHRPAARSRSPCMLAAPLLLVGAGHRPARRHLPGRDADQRDDAVVHPQAARPSSVALVIAGPWMLKVLVGYTRELFESIPA